MIELFTAATPNGQKISIALEELGLDYKTTPIDLSKGTQKEDWFLALNPNGRIPTITDHDRKKNVFESGAILQYLAKYCDPARKISFHPETEGNEADECLQWLFFGNAAIGPMQGQANHFFRYAHDKIPYAISRYQNECRRLYGVLNSRLANRTYLVGERYSIADIAIFAWIRWAPWAGLDFRGMDGLKAWCERIEARPAVKKGLQVPNGDDQIDKLRKDPTAKDPFASWVMKGQQDLANAEGQYERYQ